MARHWIEISLVLAAGFIPGFSTPLLAMLVVASVLRWVSKDSWGGRESSFPRAAGELITGAVIGALAFGAVSLVAGISTVGELAMVRGNEEALVLIAIRVAVLAAAAEMIFRGFVMSRLASATDSWGTANALAALAFGIVIGAGDIGAIAGATVAGLGYGFLYIAAQKRLALPVGAHLGFAVSAVVAAYLVA